MSAYSVSRKGSGDVLFCQPVVDRIVERMERPDRPRFSLSVGTGSLPFSRNISSLDTRFLRHGIFDTDFRPVCAKRS